MPMIVKARINAVIRWPSASHQPGKIAYNAERPGADILAAGIHGARHNLLTEGEQRVGRDVKCGPVSTAAR